MTSRYEDFTLTHWEEPDGLTYGHFVAKNGYVSVTPELIYKMLKSFEPIAYQEGEITLDIPVKSLLDYWKSLGGEYGVDK